MKAATITEEPKGQVLGGRPDTDKQTGISLARRVLATAAALYAFFETMLFVHDADPLQVADQLIKKHGLNKAEKLYFLKVAERAGRAKAIINTLEQRFGVRVGGGSLQGRMIEDTEGVTNCVFGRGGKSTLHVFSHNIMLGFEKHRWRAAREQGALGYVEPIGSFGVNSLVFRAVEKVRRNEPGGLGPLAYRAKARCLLNRRGRRLEMLRALLLAGTPNSEDSDPESQFCETMRHEIRHVIDHILDPGIRLPGKTVEVQAHLYECGHGVMRGFERDLRSLAGRARRTGQSFGASIQGKEPYLQPVTEAWQNLHSASLVFSALNRQLGDGVDYQLLSYVFSLVGISHLPAILNDLAEELVR